MKFIVSTKPLCDGLDLGVINANVSKFYQKSCVAQVSADKHNLKINLEAASIVSEIRLKGSGDSDQLNTIFVDSLLLKQLVSTLDSSTVTLEFTEGGLILHSGKSKFTLPKVLDAVDVELKAPSTAYESTNVIDIDKADWKFIKENQMYAIAMSFIHPVYTKVWVGESCDVLVGDFDNSLFTHSKKTKLGNTCLLSDTIVNLFNSLPDGAKLIRFGDEYIINVKTDGFEYIAQFTPDYESNENIGSYNSDIILSMMNRSTEHVTFNAPALNKFLSQAALLSTSTEDSITLSVGDGLLKLSDNNVDCSIVVNGDIPGSYSVEFKTAMLKSVISKYGEESVCISPMKQGEDVAGVIIWNDDLTTVLAGVE